MTPIISAPTDPALTQLCTSLRQLADELETPGAWPAEQLRLCAAHGVFEWFVPTSYGGQGWPDDDIARAYLQLSASCLTTTFVLTQLTGACRRLAATDNTELTQRLMPDLTRGKRLATLGISHLTTSRQHVGRPVLLASASHEGYVLSGFSPWVTGALHADYVVTGAVLDDGRQLMLVVPLESLGVTVPPSARLLGLSASQTGQVQLDGVHIDRAWVLEGPAHGLIGKGGGGRTGGLQTSTLALGLATSAIDYLRGEAGHRQELLPHAEHLSEDWKEAEQMLLTMAAGIREPDPEQLRVKANSLCLRATQAALAAAKGEGYVQGHPVGRWCREALFFLVWSCPQSVVDANLCELAGSSA
jgi:alkylation response protein AidB-like acyl-CoA dehydrogenase